MSAPAPTSAAAAAAGAPPAAEAAAESTRAKAAIPASQQPSLYVGGA